MATTSAVSPGAFVITCERYLPRPSWVDIRRHEHEQHVARALRVPDNQVAQLALVEALVVAGESRTARPALHGVLGRIRWRGDQEAAIDLEHLVPASGTMEAERRPLLRLRKRQLDLIAVLEIFLGADDRLDRHVGQVCDARNGVAHELLFLLELRGVCERLPAAPTAGTNVWARRLDTIGTRCEQFNNISLAVLATGRANAHTHVIAGQRTIDKNYETINARDATTAVRQRLDHDIGNITTRGTICHGGILREQRRPGSGANPPNHSETRVGMPRLTPQHTTLALRRLRPRLANNQQNYEGQDRKEEAQNRPQHLPAVTNARELPAHHRKDDRDDESDDPTNCRHGVLLYARTTMFEASPPYSADMTSCWLYSIVGSAGSETMRPSSQSALPNRLSVRSTSRPSPPGTRSVRSKRRDTRSMSTR